MADVFDILRNEHNEAVRSRGATPVSLPRTPTGTNTPTGRDAAVPMSRELANLARNNPHFTPTHIMAMSHRHPLAGKERRRVVTRERAQRWVWTPFRNSARTDGARFYHWEKADDDGVPIDVRKDYRFARLNKRIVCFMYTDAEYEQHLTFLSSDWTKEQTDELFELCRQFDLRWHVIVDRLSFRTTVECIKDRYYSVARALIDARATTDELKERAKRHPIVTNPYDYEYDVKRKQNLERMFRRSREDEEREQYIRERLKKIEAIKKRRQEEARRKQSQHQRQQQRRKRNLPTFGAAQVATMKPKRSSTPLVADILSRLDRGVYSRKTLMQSRGDASIERRIDLVVQEHGLADMVATAKVHEAYETFRKRVEHMLELQKQVGKLEAERAISSTIAIGSDTNRAGSRSSTSQQKRNHKRRKKTSVDSVHKTKSKCLEQEATPAIASSESTEGTVTAPTPLQDDDEIQPPKRTKTE